jgi:tetratricopeptide (TPR) repeat protein
MKDNLESTRKIAMILDAMLTKEIAMQGDTSVNAEELEAAENVLAQAQKTPQLEKEARELKDALRYAVVKEITSPEAADQRKIMLEMVNDILTNPKSASQLDDAKFALNEVINGIQQDRHGLLRTMDRVVGAVLPKSRAISRESLEKQANSLKRKIRDIKEKGKLQEAFYELGNILTQLGEFEDADVKYKQAVALQPNSRLAEKAKFNLAWNDKMRGKLDQALKGFQGLAEVTSDEELKVFLQFQIADILRKQDKHKDAINSLEKIAQQGSNLDLTQLSNYIAGQIYLYDLAEAEKAKEEFQKAKNLDLSSVFSKYISKQAVAAIVEQYHTAGFNLLKQAYFMSEPEKYSQALESFDRALETNPDDGFSYAGKALIFLWRGEGEKALESSKRAAKLIPDNEGINVNLAYIRIKLGLIDEAISGLKKLLSLKPKLWQAYYNLGYAYIVQNNLAEAADVFKKAAEMNPASAMILTNHGWCKWKLGEYAKAIELFERALIVEPRSKDALFNLGLIYKTSGKYEEAKAKLDKLFRIAPTYPHLEYYLSDLNRIIRVRDASDRK